MSATDSVPDLAWLADLRVFIDSRQVGPSYDAVVGLAFRTVELQVSAGQTQQLASGCPTKLRRYLSAELETACNRQKPLLASEAVHSTIWVSGFTGRFRLTDKGLETLLG